MKNIIAYLIGPKFHNAVPDPRSQEKKAQDHKYGLDVAAGSIKVGEKIKDLPFKPLNQLQTLSCGAHAATHGRMQEGYGELPSPLIWYRSRSNYPDGGMYLQDVLRIEQKAKSTAYSAYPTEKYGSETMANELPNIIKWDEQRDKDFAYVQINAFDARPVFEAVSAGHAPTISFFATINEWSFQELKIRDSISLWYAPVRHYIKAIRNSVYEKDGDLWFTALESSPQGGHVRREVSMHFLTNRMYIGAGYVYKKEVVAPAPAVTIPNEKCNFGQRSHAVLKLQTYMFEKGRMAKQHLTGYYGPITAAAVLKWQLEHLPTYPGLAALQGKWWGPASIEKAKEIR
jgi:hypothetical protein